MEIVRYDTAYKANYTQETGLGKKAWFTLPFLSSFFFLFLFLFLFLFTIQSLPLQEAKSHVLILHRQTLRRHSQTQIQEQSATRKSR